MAFEYRPSVWDDSEPDYAPGLEYRKDRDTYRWCAAKRYISAGYQIKNMKLQGHQGDGLDLERAAQCRALTREVLEWYEGKTQGRTPGTWGYVLARYKKDRFSRYHRVSPATRESYNEWLVRFENSIAEVQIKDTDIGMMYGWIERMEAKGRSASFIHKYFAHFGQIITHGVLISEPGCAEVKAIRSAMLINKPAPRTAFVTRGQMEAIVQEADRRGYNALALSVLLRFEYMLRGVDIYGQWVIDDGIDGGIRAGSRVWTTGLTWDMFDKDLTGFSKVINKTKRRMPEPYHFDLASLTSIRDRLQSVPEEKRVGPVIVMDDGLPPRNSRLTKQFKQIVRALDLPEHLQIRDLRPGGATEAREVAEPMQLRDAMGHTQISTTDLYARDRSTHANRVVELRQNKAGRS